MSRTERQASKFGPYLLDRKLAEGGMAEVYLARQTGLGGFEKQVVVKRILPALTSDQSFIEMFLNEARLAARLSHSNVVQVIGAGEIDGQYYIAMEYIDGADLRVFYDAAERTGTPTPPGIACRVIADLLGGLHYAHTRTDDHGRPLGIVHRDVTPQNVLVTRGGHVKIVDFGIAKATNTATQQTQVGQVKGKIAYLSPEQAMGRSLDARSDVFACGILLWELVTGKRLFQRPNDMASIMAITEDDLEMARSIRPELPEALDHVLRQALARPLVDRYPTAHVMQAELETLIRAQGWSGDHQALARYMKSRLGLATPEFGYDALGDMRVDDSAFGDGPTMLADEVGPVDPLTTSIDTDIAVTLRPGIDTVAPRSGTPSIKAAPIAQTIEQAAFVPVERSRPPSAMAASPPMPVSAPAPAPPERPRTPSGMAAMPHVAAHPRTPSGMRSMPPTPGPAMPHYMHPPAAYQTQPTGRGWRRVLVVMTIAILGSVGTIYFVDWHPPSKATTAQIAKLLIEVPEPALIDIDGRHARIDTTGEIEISTGRQLSLTATTARGNGNEATRTIAVPPAANGERIPLKITFPL